MAFSPRGRKRASVVPTIDSAILSSDMSFQKIDIDFESPINSERNDTDGSLQDEHPIEIAAKENKQVFYSRYLMLFVLACSAMGVAFLTYKLVTDEELEDFESQFVNDAQELIDTCESNESNIVSVLTIFSTLFSSAAKHDAATWPFFTLPDFEKFGSGARQLSGATLLVFTPLVNDVDRAGWETYSVDNQQWIEDGWADLGVNDSNPKDIPDFIYRKTTRYFLPEETLDRYSPLWQMSPPPRDTNTINFNLFNHPTFHRLVNFADFTRQAAISEVLNTELVFGSAAPQDGDHPQSLIVIPVFQEAADATSPIIGHVVGVIPWSKFFQNVLPDSSSSGVYAVLEESCGNSFTYRIDGGNVTFVGLGDSHDRSYDYLKESTDFSAYDGDLDGISGLSDHCEYSMTVYPSDEYKNSYRSDDPIYFTCGVIAVFIWVSCVFLFYDRLVQRRQTKVNHVASKTNAIVASLFPTKVREQLINEAEIDSKNTRSKRHRGSMDLVQPSSTVYNRFWNEDNLKDPVNIEMDSPPIADLFPSATVLFMDIAGFTAWSSQREPSQVFILLETIYRSFDKLAKKRKVFKVETIGDCYVAVCGVPEACKDHAVVMARFTRDCLEKMDVLVRQLEATLGPDTANLAMRAGLHSGPVTAGVLRGERARFQLFGDTVNTAARMESTGEKRKIQISKETADLLIAAKHPAWLKPRRDRVLAKGKGEMQTYWLKLRQELGYSTQASVSSESSDESDDDDDSDDNSAWAKAVAAVEFGRKSSAEEFQLDDKERRLVHYTSDILLQILKKIVAKRGRQSRPSLEMEQKLQDLEDKIGKTGICLDEVEEVIELPTFDQAAYNPVDAEVSQEVQKQLVSFVQMVASMYRKNPFHNFDHASHVTQSTSKLLSRIVAAKNIEEVEELHDNTYGITSDPLTQFAVIFSALIHDVDHRGVPNFLLVKEEPDLGEMYKRKSVAEQNSVDVAWGLLMDPCYTELRRTIYNNDSELKRFRVLVVNSIMATDIFDKELAALRRTRWENAFFGEHQDEDAQISQNRKATIVIEHIIQASDVAHTMQHWHVYSKWNENLFLEMFTAYCDGRSKNNPTDGWYKGELWFFDNYVIPLAHKLKECGVFGVSSDEYLNYALANRHEWEKKGEAIVANNVEKYKKMLQRRAEKVNDNEHSAELSPLPNKH